MMDLSISKTVEDVSKAYAFTRNGYHPMVQSNIQILTYYEQVFAIPEVLHQGL